MIYTMGIEKTHYGLRIQWGDGTEEHIHCEEPDVVEDALRKAYRFGSKAIYETAFLAGQHDEYSRREVVTRHEMGG